MRLELSSSLRQRALNAIDNGASENVAGWGFLSFSGRTRRRVMAMNGIAFLGVVAAVTVWANDLTALWERALGPERQGWVMAVAWAVSSPPCIAACARRLHDLGVSARWLLVWPVVEVMLIVVVIATDAKGAGVYDEFVQIGIGWFVVAVLLPLLLSLPPGQKGPNRFGQDPRVRRHQALAEVFR